MATTSRQTAIFGIQDWKRLYKTYQQADFQSYNFETLRKSFIDYLRQYHPESFNDFVESSEFIAMLDVIAFMGQSLAFRTDLNTRENFLDTAERRDSVVNLAKLVGYTPKRNSAAQGFLKVSTVKTTENVLDYNRNSLTNVTVRYNDCANPDWPEQFKTILNAIFVNSQSLGKPGNSQVLQGVRTDEYTINTQTGLTPVVPFTAVVDGISMQFEVVSGTSQNKDYIYEPAPVSNGDLNILHRSDNLGYASANTGWFFHFKQGNMLTRDFNLSEKITNRAVNINIDGINNDDVWLYKLDSRTGILSDPWTQTENIYGTNTQDSNRKLFSVTSRSGDQITLNFGDGVFSDVPVGSYRTVVRSSNGLEYTINPTEMQSIEISVPYVSRLGRNETATFTLDLQENISNSRARESIADIKRRAPARFYTQNRMVNGEDYTNFPYTQFSSIIKSKAVNRTNIGTSRYLDLVDPTGKYSSINTFSSDGVFYQTETTPSFGFTFVDTNDIDSTIKNQIEPTLASRQMLHFYYKKFQRSNMNSHNLSWVQATHSTNITTGYFVDIDGDPASIGASESNDRKFLDRNCLVKFVAPAGTYFDQSNVLQTGTPAAESLSKSYIWAAVTGVVGNGTHEGEGVDIDGIGAVSLNDRIPTGALVTEVIPVFNTDLPTDLEQAMIQQIELFRNFAIRYDSNLGQWAIVNSNNLAANSAFSQDYAGDTTGNALDASWLIKFETNGASYTVTSRALNYYFASVEETRFFYEMNENIYDPRTGKTINDFVKVLKTNSQPDSSHPLSADVKLDIIGQTIEVDGFVNDFNVEISFADSDQDNVPDDPDFFDLVVAPEVNPTVKNVFFKRTVDFDNLERLLPLTHGVVVTSYATQAEIEIAKTEYTNGQAFYATRDQKFYVLTVANNIRTIQQSTEYVAQVGRDDLHFQYKHNAPESRRINPGSTNIIDLYLATSDYYTHFTRWIQDTTNTVTRPNAPTTSELSVTYSTLNNYKMMSDDMVLNSVTFKPLFGAKADDLLQATFKVIKLPNLVVSDSEIKSRVIEAVNEYFAIENWDFGDTFYFSELGSFLHERLGSTIGSVVLLPKDPTRSFGDLYQVNSAPNEIFVSAASVSDVEVVDSLTASQLRITTKNGVV